MRPPLPPGAIKTWPITWFTNIKDIREAPPLTPEEETECKNIALHCDPERIEPIQLMVWDGGELVCPVGNEPLLRRILVAYEAGMGHLRVIGRAAGGKAPPSSRGKSILYGGEGILGAPHQYYEMAGGAFVPIGGQGGVGPAGGGGQ